MEKKKINKKNKLNINLLSLIIFIVIVILIIVICVSLFKKNDNNVENNANIDNNVNSENISENNGNQNNKIVDYIEGDGEAPKDAVKAIEKEDLKVDEKIALDEDEKTIK